MINLNKKELVYETTKCLHIKSTTVYVPSSGLGLYTPSTSECISPPGTKRGGGMAHSCAGEGLGESQFQRLEKKA
jgi:hypothetical protein